jgi:hypothetical protein
MKKGQLKSDTSAEDTDDDFEGNAQRETLVDNIIAEINICYPIYYDAYDLCDMHKQKSLSVFKIMTLKEICEHLTSIQIKG